MICTDAERDALMAAVEEYGELRLDLQRTRDLYGDDSPRAIYPRSLADETLAEIRAMLAPDDAVLKGEAWSQVRTVLSRFEDGSTESMAIMDGVASKAVDLVSAVLRGEATRDDA